MPVEKSVAKVTEISAESPEGFEDAIRVGVSRAAKTIHNLKSAWVAEQHVLIENGRVAGYRVHLRLTFVIDD
ncbi:MAG TPA: dodecin family protein [Thermoanaerobaculia bacterium]